MLMILIVSCWCWCWCWCSLPRQPVLEGLAWLTHWFYLPLALAIPTPMMLVNKYINEVYYRRHLFNKPCPPKKESLYRFTLSWTSSTSFGSTPSWWVISQPRFLTPLKNRQVGDLGVVGLVFNLPSHHRVHHGANRYLRGFDQHAVRSTQI